MIGEFGPPTFFLSAEYEAADIADYHHKLNTRYSISKLCTEDPISVSRKFSSKFQTFFRKVILNGGVLGDMTHYYWKKEYQAHGAPHYHVLLWIDGAPVIYCDDPKDVLSWIQERITCRIPDKESNPELHRQAKCTSVALTVSVNVMLVQSTSLIVGLDFLVRCPHLPNSIR